MSRGPLAGVRVIESGDCLAAAYCGRILAEQGAEVVKLLDPAPGGSESGPLLPPGHPVYPLYLDYGKHMLRVDLARRAGQRILLALTRRSDVLLCGACHQADRRPREMAARARRANPALVAFCITPFGLNGPYAALPSSDLVNCYASGLAYVMPEGVTDLEQDPPLRAGALSAEFFSGLCAAVRVVAAHLTACARGRGETIDFAKQEALTIAMGVNPTLGAYFKKQTGRNAPGFAGGGGVFPCRDGLVELNFVSVRQWDDLVRLMGSSEWAADPHFRERINRWQSWDFVTGQIRRWTMEQSRDDLVKRAQRLRIPCLPVLEPAQVLTNPHMRRRGVFQRRRAGGLSALVPRGLVNLTDGDAPARTGPGRDYVLTEVLHYKRRNVRRLRETGVVS